MPSLTVAVCTYNRAERLPKLIESLRALSAPISFEILVVNNNSTDDTLEVLDRLAIPHPVALRVVTEAQQGIPYARNRAVEECLDRDYMLFMDDDQLPGDNWIVSAIDAFETTSADCLGGRILVRTPGNKPPKWLTPSVLGFLGALDHGTQMFRIQNRSTPIWSGNVGYRMSLFRNHPEIRFDTRYSRAGAGIGGGEDVIMFRTLLERGFVLYYVPKMVVEHFVQDWKMRRSYFLKLHFVSGRKQGQYEESRYTRTIFGAPPFLMAKMFRDLSSAFAAYLRADPNALRILMTASHTIGMIWGLILRLRQTDRTH